MVVEVRVTGDSWSVYQDGAFVSRHRKKQRAVDKAREIRNGGEMLRVQRMDGRFQSI